MKLVSIAMMVAACGGGSSTPDAPLARDAPAQLDTGTPADAGRTVPLAKSHTLFLQTEGVTVSPGTDNAVNNTSSILGTAATLQPWLVGDADRTTKIAVQVSAMAAVLAPYNITIVTTRPAAGPYDMIIVTDDTSAKIGLSATIGAIVDTSCGEATTDVGFVFPGVVGATATEQVRQDFIALEAISIFGFMNGIPTTNAGGDCMCLSGAGCVGNHLAQICKIGGAHTPIDQSNSGINTCGVTDATMDEASVFLAAFGPH